jgi:hypothetical protein
MLESLPNRPLANYPLYIKEIETTVLINTRVEGNFINKKFVKRHRL